MFLMKLLANYHKRSRFNFECTAPNPSAPDGWVLFLVFSFGAQEETGFFFATKHFVESHANLKAQNTRHFYKMTTEVACSKSNCFEGELEYSPLANVSLLLETQDEQKP